MGPSELTRPSLGFSPAYTSEDRTGGLSQMLLHCPGLAAPLWKPPWPAGMKATSGDEGWPHQAPTLGPTPQITGLMWQ